MTSRRAEQSQLQDEVDARTVKESQAYAEVFAEAVRAARAENRRLGIPNVQTDEEGRLTEELPDGSVRLLTTE